MNLDLLSEQTSPLARLLDAGFRARAIESAPREDGPLWDAEFFGLARTKAFAALPGDKRDDLLRRLSRGLMSDAYHIELAGMAYAAKMSLLATTQEERIFFALMGEEEACHFRRLSPWFPPDPTEASPFASAIGEIIRGADRRASLFLIQILLEGWGLQYYRGLSESSISPGLRAVLEDILFDESRHHAAGVLLFSDCEPREMSDARIRDALREILEMVRIGPIMAARGMIEAHGGMTRAQVAELLTEMSAADSANHKLRMLEKVIERNLPGSVAERDWFTARTPKEMLAALV